MPSPVYSSIGAPFKDAEPKAGASRGGWNDAPVKQPAVLSAWDAANNGDRLLADAWGDLPQLERHRGGRWADFVDRVDDDKTAFYGHPPSRDRYRRTGWDSSIQPRQDQPIFIYGHPPSRDRAKLPGWDGSISPRTDYLFAQFRAPAPAEAFRRVPWGLGSWNRPDPGAYITWVAEPPAPVAQPPMPAILEAYVLMPSLSLVTTPGGDEIKATAATLTLDFDSWAWRLSATLANPASLALVKPDGNGPKEIAITINGYTWAFIVEGYSTDRSFGDLRVSISGRSLSAWLGSPYAPKRSAAITSTYSAVQLAELELAATGYSLAWGAPDWTVPGGAWSYQDTDPITAIAKIAAAVGARIRPRLSSKTLDVVPRFPVSPHLWGAAQLDAILPEAMILQGGEQWRPSPTFNRVFVSGNQTGGVIVSGQRSGTGGDLLAPQVVDALITDSIAGQERARIELDRGGNWGDVSISTFLPDSPAAPGLLLPGHLVEIQETSGNWRGQIGAVTINAASANNSISVRQNLSLERFYS